MRIRLGTRGSVLARTQSGMVADALRALGHEVELVIIRTEGDVNLAPLTQMGGVGVFAAALRQAMLTEQVDIAVHSFKDLPTAEVPGLTVAAVPPRVDPRDVLISNGRGLDGLRTGARVGTGSPRRAAQLLARRPDLEIVDIRGNVDTRIGLVESGHLDAVVLAAAGLIRLGHGVKEGSLLDLWPAPAQGALAVECRSDDLETLASLQELDDHKSRFGVTAERSVLAGLNAGCAAPIATKVEWDGDNCLLNAAVFRHDGAKMVKAQAVTHIECSAEEFGRQTARELLERGAGVIVKLADTAPSKLHNLHR